MRAKITVWIVEILTEAFIQKNDRLRAANYQVAAVEEIFLLTTLRTH